MDLRQLSLTHFRNFPVLEDIELPPGRLLVVAAPNAAGKTNFLESIVMLLRGKSWRAPTAECVQWGQSSFAISGVLVRGQEEERMRVAYDKTARALRIEENGSPVSIVTLYSRYPLIVFLPEDTFLFARGPEVRRNFLNSVLVSSPHYLPALVQYQRALRQRNAALKAAQSQAEVAGWTEVLLRYAAVITQQRQAFMAFLEGQLSNIYETLAGEALSFQVRLQEEVLTERLAAQFAEGFATEKRHGYTLWGPHRDDIEVSVEQRAVKLVLSQGQVRSLVIALKVASHRFLEQVTGERPLVLLDEVLSELDEQRQEALLTHLPEAQLIMTCTALPKVLAARDDVSVFDVRTTEREAVLR